MPTTAKATPRMLPSPPASPGTPGVTVNSTGQLTERPSANRWRTRKVVAPGAPVGVRRTATRALDSGGTCPPVQDARLPSTLPRQGGVDSAETTFTPGG